MLEIKGLKKIYKSALSKNKYVALKDINFTVEDDEFIAIMGESGSGKTTLLNILSLIDTADGGEIKLDDIYITNIRDKDAAKFRRDNIGYVFQDFNLLDTFNVRDNILLSLVLREESPKTMDEKLIPIANKLGIENLLNKYPYELSGGEKQRVAIARAIITEPKILLADEPTGQLDSGQSNNILNLFQKINEDGQSILMVTHSIIAASFAKRVLFIKDGEIFHQVYRGDLSKEKFYKSISDTLTILRSGESVI